MQKSESGGGSTKLLLIKILSLAKPEIKTLLLAGLFLAVASICQLSFPQFVRGMVDQAISSKENGEIDKIALFILLIFIVQASASTARYYLFTLAGERIVQRLRARLYAAILGQEIAFFDMNRTGDLMSRISSDTTVVQNAVSVNISMGLRNLAGALGGLALMAYTSPQLTLASLVVIPPVAIGAAVFGKRIRQFSKIAQENLAQASSVAEETISGVRTVRAFSQEPFETTRYEKSLERSLEAIKNRVSQISIFMLLASMVGYGAVTGVIWFGGRQVIADSMSVGNLTQYLIYLMIVAFSVGALGSLWGDFMAAVGAGKRIFEILERVPKMSSEQGRVGQALMGEVEFKNVNFSYPTRPESRVLKNFNLRLKPNSVVALVGSSGSGKTTVASLVTRLYDTDSGDILIDGISIRDYRGRWLRSQIGIVSQEPILISSSIEENIKYANPTASHEQVVAAAKLANAHLFISSFSQGYDTLVGERGIQLSGGQKQRVAIARAILKDPRILILDEATSALDTESEALVQDAINRVMRNRTTLIIAHRLSTVQSADLICVMNSGEIVETGTHEELLRHEKGLYRRLVEGQLHQ